MIVNRCQSTRAHSMVLINMPCKLGLHTKALGACFGLPAFGHPDASKVLCWDLGRCMNLNFTHHPFSHSAGAFGLCTFVVEPMPQKYSGTLHSDFVPISLEKTCKRSCSVDARYVLCNTVATCSN